jgi:hypothetical protein
VISRAFTILNTFGVYENALAREVSAAGLSTGLLHCLLMNFGRSRLEIKRGAQRGQRRSAPSQAWSASLRRMLL